MSPAARESVHLEAGKAQAMNRRCELERVPHSMWCKRDTNETPWHARSVLRTMDMSAQCAKCALSKHTVSLVRISFTYTT